jgi:hypothetical protein
LAQGFGVEMSGAASFRRSLSNATFEPADSNGSWRMRAHAAARRRAPSSR